VRRGIHITLVFCALGLTVAEPVSAAIIQNANGRRTVKTKGSVKITTTTSGQRRIAITIDPEITTAFRLDVLYPEDLVEPVGFGGFNTSLNSAAITFVEPYVPAQTLVPPMLLGPADNGGAGGMISNIEGAFAGMRGFDPLDPQPNRDDGGSDLFTLTFIDLNPRADKVFTVLGVDEKGIDPSFRRFIEDNFLEIKIDDPGDPLDGQIVRIGGDGIERTEIFVPGVSGGDTTRPVPLPAAVWVGIVLGVGVVLRANAARKRAG
jgi:hypothetical protein